MSDNNNMWEDDVFEDKPEEAKTGAKNDTLTSSTPMPDVHQYAPPTRPAPPKQPPPPQVPAGFEFEEEEPEEDEESEDYSEVLSDANLRLEQGSLYKLIMKHELFEGSDADPKAIQNVQKAIRKFAREQMEIMLGMRQDPQTTVVERLEIEFPFNAMEVEVLKAVAHTATKGATEHSDNYVPDVTRTTGPIPVIPEKRNTFNPIGSSPAKRQVPKKKLATRPNEPLKRSKMDSTIDEIAERLADQTVSKETIKAGLRRELEEHGQLLGKSVRDLTADEVIARNREIDRRRGGQVKSTQALPMPSAEQQAIMVETTAAPNAGKSNKLIELAMKMPPTKLLNPGE